MVHAHGPCASRARARRDFVPDTTMPLSLHIDPELLVEEAEDDAGRVLRLARGGGGPSTVTSTLAPFSAAAIRAFCNSLPTLS